VTADLDILARQALLGFLREESESGCTVVYCTHILDGLDGWATHVLRLRSGARPCEVLSVDKAPESWKLFGAVHEMLVQDAEEDVRAAGEVRAAAPKATVANGDEAKLPFGWLSRQAAVPGAYGNYAWKEENESEETWAYASVAPNPDAPGRSGAGVAGPLSGAPSPLTASQGPFGAPGAPPFGAPGAPPFGAPGGLGGPFGAPGAAPRAAPSLAGAEGLFNAAPLVDDRRPVLPPSSSASLPAGDSCPDWFASRNNQASVEDLIAQGKIAPEKEPQL